MIQYQTAGGSTIWVDPRAITAVEPGISSSHGEKREVCTLYLTSDYRPMILGNAAEVAHWIEQVKKTGL